MDNVVKSLGKILAFAGSERLWAYLIGLAVVLGVFPAAVDAEALSKEIVASILLVVQGVTALVGVVTLIISYTQRTPRGLSPVVPEDIKEVAESLLKAIKEQQK